MIHKVFRKQRMMRRNRDLGPCRFSMQYFLTIRRKIEIHPSPSQRSRLLAAIASAATAE